MEKDFNVFNFQDEDEYVITKPYYYVEYIDDFNKTHLATIKEDWYLHFLEHRYIVKECRLIEDNFDNEKK